MKCHVTKVKLQKYHLVMLHFYYVNPQSQQYTTTYIYRVAGDNKLSLIFTYQGAQCSKMGSTKAIIYGNIRTVYTVI